MSDQFRVCYGTGLHTRYAQYGTLEQAQEAAADTIRAGDASQVVIESMKDGKWLTVSVGKRQR